VNRFYFLVLFLFLLPFARESRAHPQYIRLGYFQCASCHFNPLGTGLLKPYGEGVQYAESYFDREIAEPVESEAAIKMQHGLLSRFAYLKTQIKTEAFLMQLDYLNRSEFSKNISLTSTIGLTSPRAKKAGRAGNGALGEWMILRELYLRHASDEGESWLFGREALPSGVNPDDHTLYIRSKTRHGVTDYPTQLQYMTASENRSATYYAYLPSYEEDRDNRENGFGVRGEFRLSEKNSLGILSNYGWSETLVRYSLSPFARLGLTEDFAILAQLDFTVREIRMSDESFFQKVYFFKPIYSFKHGIELGYVLEKLDVSGVAPQDSFQHGVSASLRAVGRLSLLAD